MMESDGLQPPGPCVAARAPRKLEGDAEGFGVVSQDIRKGGERRRIRKDRVSSLSAFEEEGKFRWNARLFVRAVALSLSLGKGRDMRSLDCNPSADQGVGPYPRPACIPCGNARCITGSTAALALSSQNPAASGGPPGYGAGGGGTSSTVSV
jgi:hypothetical protein